MEWELDALSSEASNVPYFLLPAATRLRKEKALANAWVCAAVSRSASKKWRVVKYAKPPMLMERRRAPSPKMAVMRAPMPTQGTSL